MLCNDFFTGCGPVTFDKDLKSGWEGRLLLEKRNLLLTIAYDGRAYHGWQIQENALSVQEVFQGALRQVIGDDFDVKGCSRTDSGVHANQYCISLKTGHRIPCERLVAALNRFLPMDMAVKGCRSVSLDFHARYSCKGKEYQYLIWNDPVRNPFLTAALFTIGILWIRIC